MQIIPKKTNTVETTLPSTVEGVISPYPTVVMLTTENHKDLIIDPKCSGSAFLSIKNIIEANVYVKTDSKVIGKKVLEGLSKRINLSLFIIDLN